MDTCAAILTIDGTDRVAFRKSDLRRILGGGAEGESTIRRLAVGGLLRRAGRGVYYSVMAARRRLDAIYEVARCLRRGEFMYESLESAASIHGLVSQCIQGVTIATSGSSHTFSTELGVIDFVHVDGVADRLADGSAVEARTSTRMPLSTAEVALEDMVAAGRPTGLIEEVADGPNVHPRSRGRA